MRADPSAVPDGVFSFPDEVGVFGGTEDSFRHGKNTAVRPLKGSYALCCRSPEIAFQSFRQRIRLFRRKESEVELGFMANEVFRVCNCCFGHFTEPYRKMIKSIQSK